jgi:hypothetical protein
MNITSRLRPALAALAAITFGSTPLHAGSAGSVDGAWSGMVAQGSLRYNVRMSAAGDQGRIEYPELGCGGTLFLQDSSGGTYRFRERITWGKDKCIDGGEILLAPTATSKWAYAWRGGRGVTARGLIDGILATDL